MRLTSASGRSLLVLCAVVTLGGAALAAPAPAGAAGRAAAGDRPDLILVHGTVLTMSPQGLVAEAVAVKGNTIVDVGTDARIRGLAGPGTRTIDLQGKVLAPGFVDPRVLGAFGFWEIFGGAKLTGADGTPLAEPDAIEAAVRAFVAERKPQPGAWIVAGGFDPRIASSRKMRRDLLDRAAPENPVLTLSLDHHAALLNSKGIELAGLKSLPFPERAGTIERDANGEPTGLVREAPVFLLMNKVWSILPDSVRRDAALGFVGAAGRFGITTTGILLADPADLTTDAALLKQDELSVRTVLQPLGLNQEATRALQSAGSDARGADPDRLLVGPPIAVLDGKPMGYGAALFQPYKEARWTSGFLTMTPEGVDDLFSAWSRGGQGMAVEASGSLASHIVLDAAERALALAPAAAGAPRPLLRVDGLEMLTPRDAPRLSLLAKAGAVVSLQPALFPFRVYLANAVGEEAMQTAMPYRSLVDAGVAVALSSDWPMTSQTFQPTQLMEWAVTRTGLRADEGLTVEQSLRAVTLDAARALGLQDRIGSIEAGKKADFVVLDRNPLDPSLPKEDLSEIKVRMTLLDGAVVYEDRSASPIAERAPARGASTTGTR